MKKKREWIRIGIIILAVVFIISTVTFEIFEFPTLVTQFIGALLGVVITAIITVLLLQGQSRTEENLEKKLKVFEKKQEIYFNFLEKLNTILQNEDTQRFTPSKKQFQNEELNLQDLLFEFGYLKMHTTNETFSEILVYVSNLIEENNKLKFLETASMDDYNQYYQVLANNYFSIVTLLKKELYAKELPHFNTETINTIINNSLKGY
ncbi:hypothetical protein [Myroides guanonis]|uniref:Uncharacterized protein n=1 Tax=Myroides guanonis TaxID=1150112 RepID=A0A1I3RC85_9FLAO|nr:hypothetical protein [Myroides guanonis]SFJ42806.1 hypothetical protein SAMN04487893_10798 [Myroides guanonis]